MASFDLSHVKVTHRRKILIIDDDPSVTQLLTILLETRGFEVIVATSGNEAFDKVSPKIDLILLELVLPDMEGFEVCRKFREAPLTHHIPIIILSAKYLFEDKIEGLYLGADDYLTKPFSYEELFARMDAVMRRGWGDGQSNGIEAIIMELREILDKELIIPFFQPIYFFEPFHLYGLEVLSRPITQSVLSNPEVLFKMALQFGCYNELEILSWRKAVRLISRYLKTEKLFLNCNPYLVESPQFAAVKTIFEENSIPPQNVILEITERSAISDFKMFYEQLREYRDYGFRFAVDDVGGGYASLESIVETKPEVVKIDRHIVCDISRDSFKKSIVKFIVSFCREQDIISIAEGIESKEDLKTLIELGVDAGQGYLLYRPTAQPSSQYISQHFSV